MSKWLLAGAALLVMAAVLCTVLDGARLHPDRREVLVKEVDNGYTIHYKTSNNPYPVREAVATSAGDAAAIVKDYLKSPLPETHWGK